MKFFTQKTFAIAVAVAAGVIAGKAGRVWPLWAREIDP